MVDALGEMAEERGCTISQLALAWVIWQPGVTSAIIGPSTRNHLDDNLDSREVEISAD